MNVEIIEKLRRKKHFAKRKIISTVFWNLTGGLLNFTK